MQNLSQHCTFSWFNVYCSIKQRQVERSVQSVCSLHDLSSGLTCIATGKGIMIYDESIAIFAYANGIV